MKQCLTFLITRKNIHALQRVKCYFNIIIVVRLDFFLQNHKLQLEVQSSQVSM